ncbi:pyridine nucleotide-disulphide oxidoreductase associated with reductive pyrimidine catabolism [Bacillus sp. JCM 19046]|nr:pyridine nucleotide-disulphide oxidoreductase associated with reductive pyrimidine catabolism [Bacillus sp. JCM 19045]GAF20256.1 pyridine nucleotide-disulphide oxidoreductase associated with reductive pyrimidine catabolism [Bacillus sp. JCM 19046]
MRLLDELQLKFEEVEPPLTSQEAMDEATRCLYCYDAPCITACPTGIDIPTFIKKITTDNLLGSARTIMEANPVGASCARVCPTEELCEGACVLNHSSKAISIGKLQRFATDWAIHNEKILFKAGKKTYKRVAVIGSGPAGLSAARELALLGYDVTIYEKEAEAGGLDTYGIVSFRLPKRISFWEVEQVKSVGVTIQTSTTIGQDLTLKELQETYHAVVLAVGMANVPTLGIPGEDASNVYDAIEFVKATKSGTLSEEFNEKRGVVIGAGNTAIDGATCAIRLGATNVKILYRRTEKEMTAYDFEYTFAKQDGVEFRWLHSPTRILHDENGQVYAIECMIMALGDPDQAGRRRPFPTGQTKIIETDFVITAIGQSRHDWLVQAGIKTTNGIVSINREFETTAERIYACGDVIFGDGQGEAMVVSAAEQGKQAAYAIHQKLLEERAETSA